jgi:hypothetical protein
VLLLRLGFRRRCLEGRSLRARNLLGVSISVGVSNRSRWGLLTGLEWRSSGIRERDKGQVQSEDEWSFDLPW